MSRYRRINLDGLSITETRVTAAAIQPGTFAVINGDDKFAVATAVVGRLYVINPAYSQGLGITDAVPAGDSAVGEYVEESRELAVRVGPGTYKKDQPITVNATGQAIAVPATAGTYSIIGYSQDDATVAAATTDFIRIRVRASSVVVA
jgi:hypothetical protein